MFVLDVNLHNASGAGVRIGMNEDSSVDTIPVTAGETYTLKFWHILLNGFSSPAKVEVYNQSSVQQGSTTTFNIFAGYNGVTVTFTASVGTTHIYFDILKTTPFLAHEWNLTGFMLVDGASAPTAFNSGSALHWRENVAAYVSALEFRDGMQAAYQGMAQPARMLISLENTDGEWLPENSGSPFYGTLVPGTLVFIEAVHGGDVPLWQGVITQISVSADETQPFVTLTVEDAMLLLQDTTFTPPLMLDTRTGAALEALFDSGVIVYPYPGEFTIIDSASYGVIGESRLFVNWITDFDEGQTVLPYVGDNADSGAGIGAQAYITDLVGAELGGRFAFDAAQGKFIFHDRHHDIYLPAPTTTLTRAEVVAAPYLWADDLKNVLTVGYIPRRVGAAASVLYSLPNVPLRLAAGATRTFTAPYRNPDNSVQPVGGLDMIAPLVGTDYIALSEERNSTPTASGAYLGTQDYSRYQVVQVEFGAASAKVTVKNAFSEAVYLTLFQLRGTPIIADTRQEVAARDAESIGDYGLRRRQIEVPALGDGALAQQYARYLVNRYHDPIGRFAAVTLRGEYSDALMTKIVNLQLGDYIDYADSYLENAQQRYAVVGREHRFNIAGNSHEATFTLQPVEREPWAKLDTVTAIIDTSLIAL